MDVAQIKCPSRGDSRKELVMVINTNLSAQNAATLLMQSSSNLSASLQRLSSGSKITSPASDSAGLAVSMKLTAQMARIDGASNNVNNAVSFSQTQDGYVQQINTAFSRMSELAVLAQDVTKTTSDRALYQQEFTALGNYISNVSTQSFNGVSLFDGSALHVTTDSEGNTFQMSGINLASGTYATAAADDITSIDTYTDLNGVTHSGAKQALIDVKAAITQLASDRANIGSNEETLSYYSNQLSTLKNNLSSANSQIMDVDVATESTNYAKENILVQTGTAMLAQANSLPQSVLKLLS
jgi:flagellin